MSVVDGISVVVVVSDFAYFKKMDYKMLSRLLSTKIK